jgi:hypothetical protein
VKGYEEWLDQTSRWVGWLVYLAVVATGLLVTLGAVWILERCTR